MSVLRFIFSPDPPLILAEPAVGPSVAVVLAWMLAWIAITGMIVWVVCALAGDR